MTPACEVIGDAWFCSGSANAMAMPFAQWLFFGLWIGGTVVSYAAAWLMFGREKNYWERNLRR